MTTIKQLEARIALLEHAVSPPKPKPPIPPGARTLYRMKSLMKIADMVTIMKNCDEVMAVPVDQLQQEHAR